MRNLHGRRPGGRFARRRAWSGLVAAMLAVTSAAVHAQATMPGTTTTGGATTPGVLPGTFALPTGKIISPTSQAVSGAPQNVGSLPSNMVLTPDGKFALVSDIGFREFLTCLNTATGQLAQPYTAPATVPADGSVTPPPTSPSLLPFGAPYNDPTGLYYGLAVTPADANGNYTVYASQGVIGTIAVVNVDKNGVLTQTGTITLGSGDAPAGLSLDNAGHLYIAVNVNANGGLQSLVTPGSLIIYDTKANALLARITLNTKTFGNVILPSNSTARRPIAVPFTPTSFPYAVQALAGGSKVYVSSQRDGLIYSVNTATRVVTPITTGSHPIAFTTNAAQTTLYVANAQDDTVSVINTATDTVTNTISLRPAGSNLPGVSPSGLALSPDGNTLYASLSDMNAVAVVSLANTSAVSYVPVGWYPTAVAAVNGGSNLLVANGKGTAQANPNPGHVKPTVSGKFEDTFYDQSIIEGNVSDIAVPSGAALAAATAQVISNNLTGTTAGDMQLAALGLGGSKTIKHVLYIIKENRTYDQVLGDGYNGSETVNGQPVNGLASLAVFGQAVSPNLHELAHRFLWLDNFYDCAEVSPDGYNWSTQSIANEYVIKNVPNNYSGRRASYDFEGQVNNYLAGGFPAVGPDGQIYSAYFPNGGPAVPDVDTAANGYIWDDAQTAGLSFRNYGLYENGGVKNLSPDNYPSEPGIQPGGHYTGGVLNPNVNGRSDIDFREFDTNYADSDAPTTGGNNKPYPTPVYGKYSAQNRFQEWNREFQAMLATDPSGNSVPNFEMIKLMSDHTAGYTTGRPTPVNHVADNDYGVAELVQAVSSSPIWNSTAIFIVEDDAQDGPDHVDCHRSTCYVISPYVRPNTVDHTFHNTDSVLHSIELLLSIPPLSQYDAYAPSFGADFDSTTTNEPAYTAIAETPANATNIASAAFLKAHPAYKALVAMTAKMDFTKEDKAPAQLLNEVIWKSVKGMNSVMPAPRHGVLVVKAAKGAPHTDND